MNEKYRKKIKEAIYSEMNKVADVMHDVIKDNSDILSELEESGINDINKSLLNSYFKISKLDSDIESLLNHISRSKKDIDYDKIISFIHSYITKKREVIMIPLLESEIKDGHRKYIRYKDREDKRTITLDDDPSKSHDYIMGRNINYWKHDILGNIDFVDSLFSSMERKIKMYVRKNRFNR